MNKNELSEIVKFLSQTGVVEVVSTCEENELIGIYYQSKIMKQSYKNYPEFLLCDWTFKLNIF